MPCTRRRKRERALRAQRSESETKSHPTPTYGKGYHHRTLFRQTNVARAATTVTMLFLIFATFSILACFGCGRFVRKGA